MHYLGFVEIKNPGYEVKFPSLVLEVFPRQGRRRQGEKRMRMRENSELNMAEVNCTVRL